MRRAPRLSYAPAIRRPLQLVTAVALVGGLLAAPGAAAGAQGRLPSNPTPVNWANFYRDTARLAPAPENPALSDAARKHATYLVKNDVIQHTEEVGNPWYTPEGAAAGQGSNVFGSSSQAVSDNDSIDFWMQGPFHAVGILDPRLTQTGFGSFREAGGSVAMASALHIASVGAGNAGFPVRWPGDGMSVPLAAYLGSEAPDPLTSCAGFSAPTGLPVLLMLGPGTVLGNVSASLTANGAQQEICIFDGSNYRHPDAGVQALGRSVLSSRGAVVVVPRQPLRLRTRYDVSISAGGQTHAWTFARSSSWNGALNVQRNGSVQSSPAVAGVRGSERVDVFVRGSDSNVYLSQWTGSQWLPWQYRAAPPGGAVGEPAAVSWAPGRLDVFVRGPDSKLWQTFSTDAGATWSNWIKPLGDEGTLASGPAVTSRGPGRLDVFVRGTDGQVYQRFYDGGWNPGWLPQGAPPPSTDGEPAAASQDSARVDLFVRGGDGRLWQKAWNGAQWSAWAQPPGSGSTALASAPSAASWGPGHLAVFARGPDGGLIQLTFDNAWSIWAPVGRTGELIQSAAGATSRGAGRVDVFVRGTDNLPYQFWS